MKIHIIRINDTVENESFLDIEKARQFVRETVIPRLNNSYSCSNWTDFKEYESGDCWGNNRMFIRLIGVEVKDALTS